MKQASLSFSSLLIFLFLPLSSQAATPQAPTHKVQGKRLAAQSPPLSVVGNKLKTRTGETVRLQGVNIPSLEWSDTGDSQLMQSVDTALSVWHANVIRLPLSQDRWFGMVDKQLDDGAAYRKVVDNVVQAVSAKHAYVIIDLHWSNGGAWGKDIGQHNMPDLNSIFFWKDAAAHFANNPAVLFDLYNEPHDVSWDIWKSGGMVTESDKKRGTEKTYRTPGLQKLLDTVRATGAKNIVVAGGLDWAYDLSGVMNGYALDDPGVNAVMYATLHIGQVTCIGQEASRASDCEEMDLNGTDRVP